MKIFTWEDLKKENARLAKNAQEELALQQRLLKEEQKRNAWQYEYEKHRLDKYGDINDYKIRTAIIKSSECEIEAKIKQLEWKIDILTKQITPTYTEITDDYAYDVMRDNLLAWK